MSQVSLTDDQWRKIRDFLREDPNAYVDKTKASCHLFVKATVDEWGVVELICEEPKEETDNPEKATLSDSKTVFEGVILNLKSNSF